MAAIPFTENVIPQLLDWRRAGISSALITLVGVDGSSPRRIGSQMAVNANGDHLGYISSGCAEAAIVAEALAAIEAGACRTIRYGAGSKYIDVVLPCGSGIDVHFDPVITATALEAVQDAIAARQSARLDIALSTDNMTGRQSYARHYIPAPRIIIAGRGVGVDYVAAMACQLEWDVVVASPDEAMLARVASMTTTTQHLTKPDDFDPVIIDARSAVVLLFHDHDWEPPILAKCAQRPAFYVGALGSRRTHAQRKELLEALGCPVEFIASIRSPVGLAIGAMNPPEIGVAVIAEIMSRTPQRPNEICG